MKRSHLVIVTILLLTSCVHTEVDVTGELSGVVTDYETSKPLADCMLLISPGNHSVTTDIDGSFNFGLLEIGKYTIKPFLDSYEQTEISILLEASKPYHLELKLKKATPPLVNTLEAENITDRAAQIKGSIVSTGGLDLIEVGFYYGTENNLNKKIVADIEGNDIMATIVELKPETEYFYKTYACNDMGESCGEIKNFNTTERQLPDIMTLNADNITSISARLNASILPDLEGVENCGFYFGTSENDMEKVDAIIGNHFFFDMTELTPRVTYFFKAFVSDNKTEKVGSLVSFTTSTLVYQGQEYVDFGLPSGLKWAVKNLGAKTQEDDGDYYAWGETSPKTEFDISNYKHCRLVGTTKTGSTTTYSYEYSKYITEDGLKQLEIEDDAARAQWGGTWRMPTQTDFDELKSKCRWTWTNVNGVNGYLVVGPNKSSIFIPYAGYYGQYIYGEVYHTDDTFYWSSTLSSSTGRGICLDITNTYVTVVGFIRYYGFLIRPVYK